MSRSLEPGRGFRPMIIVDGHAISTIEQGVHVLLVKRLVAVRAKVLRDAGQIEIDSILPCDGIDSIQVSYTLVFYKGSILNAG